MPSFDIVLDNPILMKHIRSRLRRAQVVPWLVVIVLLSLCASWAGFAIRWLGQVGALAVLLGLQVLLLPISGSQQIAGSVGGARESGILDFHRVSPVPPLWLAVGFFLGAPIREYLLAACTIPFAIFSAMNGPAGILGLIQLEIPLLLAAWIFQAIALLTALLSKKPKGAAKGGFGGLIVLLLFLGQPVGLGLWYATGQLHEAPQTLSFFGIRLPWLPFMIIYEIPILAFLFAGAARKMRGDRVHAYSKRLAIGFLAAITVLTLGATWSIKGVNFLVLGVLYGLIIFALFMVVAITPSQAEYIKGLRRAAKHDLHRPSVWDDSGTNRIAVFALSAIVFLGATVAWEAIEGRPAIGVDRGLYSQTIAIGVLVVAYFGLGLQYLQLRMAKTGAVTMAVFLFLVWMLPIVAGAIALGALPKPDIGQAVMAFSPITGIAMSAGTVDLTGNDMIRLVALAPAVTFAFVFNYFLVATQRKIDLAIHKDMKQSRVEF
jgi:hypothetical protein